MRNIGYRVENGDDRDDDSNDHHDDDNDEDDNDDNTKDRQESTLCYAIALPGRKSGFRAAFRPNSNREWIKSALR